MELVVISKEELKELIKGAVTEAIGGKTSAKAEPAPKKEEKVVDINKTEKEVSKNVSDDAMAEIESLAYNDLKKKCKELGISPVGKRDMLLERIKKALAGVADEEESNNTPEEEKSSKTKNKPSKEEPKEEPEEEDIDEESEDDEEFDWEEGESKEVRELLDGLKKPQLLEIASEMELEEPEKFKKKAFIDFMMTMREDLLDALILLGYLKDNEEDEDVEEPEEEEEEVTLADDLAEFSMQELAEICAENGLSAKGKKQSLIDRIVKAVENGDIDEDDIFGEDEDAETEDVEETEEDMEEGYTEEELEEMSDEELKELASEYDIEIPKKKVKKGKKTVSVLDRDALISALLEDEDEDEDEDEEDEEEYEDEDFEVSDERLNAEMEVEEEIRKKYKSKKLKDTAIKSFLTKYNEGNPDFNPKKLNKEDALEEYIDIHKALVDDEGEVHDLEDIYFRNDEYFCCGKQVEETDDTFYCNVCGTEYTK